MKTKSAIVKKAAKKMGMKVINHPMVKTKINSNDLKGLPMIIFKDDIVYDPLNIQEIVNILCFPESRVKSQIPSNYLIVGMFETEMKAEAFMMEYYLENGIYRFMNNKWFVYAPRFNFDAPRNHN